MRRTSWSGLQIGMPIALGASILMRPVLSASLVGIGIATLLPRSIRSSGPRLFLALVAFILIGYAFLGRGFASLGVPPVFIGEVVLVLGVVWVLARHAEQTLRLPLLVPAACFVIWCAFITARNVPIYGVEALRDAVIWAYAAYALLVFLSLVVEPDLMRRGIALYVRLAPWILLWIPIAIVLSRLDIDLMMPTRTDTDVPVLGLKPGDAAVHLLGLAAAMIVGLPMLVRRGREIGSRLRRWSLWLLWLIGFLVMASQNRGGLVAICVGLLALIILVPGRRWWMLGAIATGLVLVLAMHELELDVQRTRTVSASQIGTNVRSIVTSTSRMELEGSKQWRLQWWGDIVDYTVFGPHFWTGKGFGVNLADDDGYQVADGSLRSPHNGHLTLLARVGVPGFLLWMWLQLAFGIMLLRERSRARRHKQHWWAAIDVWILVYWLGFMINAAFDVYLEGPQGGIWFWSVFGFGLAAIALQRRERALGLTGWRPAP